MATIFISIGSNVERHFHLNRAYHALHKHFSRCQFSRVFESEAIGFKGRAFYNLVAQADTELDVQSVVTTLKTIELENGRELDAKKYAPRTLDLDLLLYDDLCCSQPTILPREEIPHNAFVLWPLAELAPNRIHPTLKQSYASLWREYDKQKQQLQPIAFQFEPLNT